jgi:hypothetical protein
MKYKKRIYEDRLNRFAKLFKIVLLVGARQVGKSTLLSKLFPKVKLFVFDPIQDLFNARNKPDFFLQDFTPPLILDEIQYAPELLTSLKRKVDTSEDNGQYFLTGSSQLAILKTVAESLAGRVVIIPIAPMTPQEMYDSCQLDENWFLDYIKNPNTFFKDRCVYMENLPTRLEAILKGGMPGTIPLESDALSSYFSSYVQTYIERDVRLIENIENLGQFGQFLGLVAALTSQEINYSQLGREVGITPKTAQRWLQLLKQTYQWHELPPFHMNAIKRLSQKPKGILADTGIACYLQLISTPEALAKSMLGGAMFETYCFNMIKGLCAALPIMPNFYHWRTLAGAEVDFIIEIDGKFYPIEVKSATTISKHDTRGIEAFRETYPHLNIQMGVIVYAGQHCQRITENIVAVPWNMR